jgi:class 3 adenylate cyclase
MNDQPTRAGRAERKLATVLFADLVGSTELGASQDPERTRTMLDRFYDAMADEISRAGGTVEKFAGDAVMAAFGVPAAQEDHVERALHAGLAMQRRLGELFGGTLSVRIGVNTGEVVVGRAREESSFVTGDAVNVAARLEQAAKPGEILVGERAAALVAGAFEFAAPTRGEAKGKAEGVECEEEARRILEASPAMAGPWGVDGPAARLDALLALGETERIEEEAAPFLEQESYAQPFALRALGVSRGDASLLSEAESRFEAMGLGWRAVETRSLAAGARTQ